MLMKKIFTLIVTTFASVGMYAQTTLIDFPTSKDGITFTGTTTETTVKIHLNVDAVACYKLANGFTTDEVYNNNSINLEVEGGFKAGDVITISGAINNTDESKRGTVVVFTLDGTTPTALNTFDDFINSRFVAEDPAEQSYTLEADADKIYLGRDGNTATNVTLIKVVRGGSAGVSTVKAEQKDGAVYNLAGQKVGAGYKGLVIKNGRKYMK